MVFSITKKNWNSICWWPSSKKMMRRINNCQDRFYTITLMFSCDKRLAMRQKLWTVAYGVLSQNLEIILEFLRWNASWHECKRFPYFIWSYLMNWRPYVLVCYMGVCEKYFWKILSFIKIFDRAISMLRISTYTKSFR